MPEINRNSFSWKATARHVGKRLDECRALLEKTTTTDRERVDLAGRIEELKHLLDLPDRLEAREEPPADSVNY